MNRKAKDTIHVYDICSLADMQHLNEDIIAERLAPYLVRHADLRFPHRHSFYHLVYFTKGGGSHSIDFERFAIKSGQIYFMIPGQVHSWYFEEGIDGYIINFSEHLLHSFIRDGQYLDQFPFFSGVAGDGVIQLKKYSAVAEKLLACIVDEVNNEAPFSAELVKANLLSLLIHVAREVMPGKPKPLARQNQLLLHNFRKLVEGSYSQKRLPKDYAAMLYITPNHLNALCSEMLGKPAGAVIRDRVLLEAKRLLVSGDITIAEIAWQLDFKDNSYFTKFFKKYTGATPEDFRKSAVEKS